MSHDTFISSHQLPYQSLCICIPYSYNVACEINHFILSAFKQERSMICLLYFLSLPFEAISINHTIPDTNAAQITLGKKRNSDLFTFLQMHTNGNSVKHTWPGVTSLRQVWHGVPGVDEHRGKERERNPPRFTQTPNAVLCEATP